VDGYDFRFLQFDASEEPLVLETDVVIIGSGCGGAVCAKNLAEAGHRVIVVEKGYYFPPAQLPMPQAESAQHLFENGGAISSKDNSTNIVAGSCWGGGGAINWSVSLQPQDFVRKEWAEEHGLSFFQTQDFQESLDRICDLMEVTDKGVQSTQGQMILDGGKKLGYHAAPTPRNYGDKEHTCGSHCHFGCGSGEKMGTAITFLPAAAKAGAQFIEGLEAELVMDEADKSKAIGIKGTWTSRDKEGGVSSPPEARNTREILVKAKKVVVSAGTLWSPVLLLKAGFKVKRA
jgi:choline dehydrogenase-like flavoprotein